MRGLALAVAGILLTGCGTQTAPDVPGGAGAAADRVQTAGAPTVLDDGSGAELCLGGVAESLPPQCGGPPITNWDWAEHEGHFEEASGTRWGEFHLAGTFDGQAFTATEVTPADEWQPPATAADDPFVTACEEPAGGWVVDASRVGYADQDAAFRVANRLPDYAGAFIDTSRDPRPPEQLDQAMADGGSDSIEVDTWVVNVQVTEDPAQAEAAIREVWGGGLCITGAAHTERELRRIQRSLADVPGFLSSGVSDDVVELGVVHDDGSIQAWADEEYGRGLVRVSSALVPASG